MYYPLRISCFLLTISWIAAEAVHGQEPVRLFDGESLRGMDADGWQAGRGRLGRRRRHAALEEQPIRRGESVYRAGIHGFRSAVQWSSMDKYGPGKVMIGQLFLSLVAP